jgi:hypothetical protein
MNKCVYEYVQIDAIYHRMCSGNSGLFITVIKIISLDSLNKSLLITFRDFPVVSQ